MEIKTEIYLSEEEIKGMCKEEIESYTKKCSALLGYSFFRKVDQDISDIGGIYEKTDIYSKIPIEVHEYDNDLVFFTDEFYKKARPSLNECLYIENPDFKNDWNQIIKVKHRIIELGHSWFQMANTIQINENNTISSNVICKVKFNTTSEKESTVELISEFLNKFKK